MSGSTVHCVSPHKLHSLFNMTMPFMSCNKLVSNVIAAWPMLIFLVLPMTTDSAKERQIKVRIWGPYNADHKIKFEV